MRRGEIYFCHFNGASQGSEQTGDRPVLIIQNNTGNKYSPTTIVALITSSQSKANLPTHVNLRNYLKKDSIVLCEQLRTISKTRLGEFVCTLSDFKMKEIDNALRISLNLIDEEKYRI